MFLSHFQEHIIFCRFSSNNFCSSNSADVFVCYHDVDTKKVAMELLNCNQKSANAFSRASNPKEKVAVVHLIFLLMSVWRRKDAGYGLKSSIVPSCLITVCGDDGNDSSANVPVSVLKDILNVARDTSSWIFSVGSAMRLLGNV